MPETSKLYALLEHSAKTFPEHTALVCGDITVTYRELNERAVLLSEELKKQNIAACDRVGIFFPKSIDAVIAIFAVLKNGSAYLPLDVQAPPQRNGFIIRNCGLKVILAADDEISTLTPNHSYSGRSGNTAIYITPQKTKPSPAELAYVLYTSGSTGNPKGVMFGEDAAMAFIRWAADTFPVDSSDRFSSHAPFHFDLSIFDIFVAIAVGATVVLIDAQTAKHPLLLSQLIAEQRISVWYSTPTILNMISTYGKPEQQDHSRLRLVLFAGEVFPARQLKQLIKQWPQAMYYNLYGPTETNVCTWHPVDKDKELPDVLPIGRCCGHYSASVSADGELQIAGSGLMLGYWDAELDRTAFRTDAKGIRWYCTGDLVSRDEHENLVFRGRRDRMVKRHGYRIELAEIEQGISRHPQVNECAAVALQQEGATTQIKVFIACNDPAGMSVIQLKQFCSQELPMYMIPDEIIFVSALPKTSSDKTDYQKLLKHDS